MVTRKVSEPVQDALKAYLELALGLTEASKKKAEKAVKKMAKELVGKGNATAAQIQGAVEDLVATSASNREAVTRLVRVEMDRTLSRVGLATSEEVATLQARVDALERQLRDERAAAAKPAAEKAAEKATEKAIEQAIEKAAEEAVEDAAERKPAVAKKAKATVKKASGVKKEPTIKAASTMASPADVPVAPKKVTAKKAVKKSTPPRGATR